MRQIKRPLNQCDSISKNLSRIRRGVIQIKQPLNERVLFDYFSIGCCVVELILGKDADSFFKKLIDFESDPHKTPVSLIEIFQMNQMGQQPIELQEFVYASLALLPDKSLDLEALLKHEFLNFDR